MEKNNISRKDFLTNSSKYAMGAVAGVIGLNALAGNKVKAGTNAYEWPWAYTELDPEALRVKAHTLYYSGKDCCSGVYGAFTDVLKEAIGEPWTNMPMEVMLFGRGGGVGWGATCGTLMGGAALISLVVDKAASTGLINELWGWYNSEQLPTDSANAATYELIKYDGALPQNISGSPLCHQSVSQWCLVAGKSVGDVERKERCARIAGDIAAKTAELLNAHFAGTFTSTFVDSATVAACLGCHGSAAMNNVMTHMECATCHGDPHEPGTSVEPLHKPATSYELSQNYPNPFNPSTKIQFSIPKESKVQLAIYDIQGSLVTTLINHEVYSPGSYAVDWNGNDVLGKRVSSGVYFARIETGNFMKTVKMNLVK